VTSSQHQQTQQQSPTTKHRSARNSATDGMRREWKFVLQFVHVAGQLLVPCSPQWEYNFIDIDRTAYGLAQRAHPSPADETPMLAVLSYTDRTAVVPAALPPSSRMKSPGTAALHRHSEIGSVLGFGGLTTAAAAAVQAGGAAGAGETYDELVSTGSVAADPAAALAPSAGGAGDWWVEKSKQVELLYCHPPPEMTLEQFCKYSVKLILRDPRVVSVDGDSRLAHLRVGDKLRCPYLLGGQHRAFHMRYVLRDRSELQLTYVYAIGCVVGLRGYLLRAQCTSAEELEGYVQTVLLPNYTTVGRARFGVDVTYHNVPPTTLLTDQQEAFGELQYVDHKAAIVFVTPVYPMKILPDYSPAKTVGVGSITCMTLELSVHERLLDDAVAAEIIGLAKYKVNTVVLCVEVEEVSRMGYPKVMSTEQYSELKAQRVADVFADAKMVGLPTSLYMGNRTGRSRTMTFTYEPLRCVVKALVTSTLVGNFGVTAFYLTKLSGGIFDSHLYVFQQLLSGLEFLPQNNFVKNARVSRYQVQNIRLGEEDLQRAYRCVNHDSGVCGSHSSTASTATRAGGGERSREGLVCPALPPHPVSFTTRDPTVVNAARERHLQMLALGNDGRVEGGVEVVVPAGEGGVPSRHAVHHAANGRTKSRGAGGAAAVRRSTVAGESAVAGEARPASASLLSVSRSTLTVVSMTSGGYVAAAAGVGDGRHGAVLRGGGVYDDEGGAAAELGSTHSGSRISVEGISHLLSSTSGGSDDTSSNENSGGDEDEGGIAHMENEMEPSMMSRDAVGLPLIGDGGVAAEQGAFSTSSLHPQGSQRSPMSAGAAGGSGRVREGSSSSSAAASRPASARRRKHGEQRGPLETPLLPPVSTTASGAEDRASTGEAEATAAAGTAEPAASEGAALVAATAAATNAAAASAANEEVLRQQELYEQLIGKGDPLVQQTLMEGDGGTPYGPSLRDVYARCCEVQQCRPNSYLMQKLPAQPELTYSVEELDLSSNYVGHNGFVAVLHLLEHLPRLRVVYFNNMSLDNTDVESLCYVLAANATVQEVHLENNIGISLPATRHFTALLRVNRRIEVLALDGTRLSPALINSLKAEATRLRDNNTGTPNLVNR
jgi:hypothetical protein